MMHHDLSKPTVDTHWNRWPANTALVCSLLRVRMTESFLKVSYSCSHNPFWRISSATFVPYA